MIYLRMPAGVKLCETVAPWQEFTASIEFNPFWPEGGHMEYQLVLRPLPTGWSIRFIFD